MFTNHSPESSSIWSHNWLALIEDSCTALKQRTINNIRMANDPTHIRGCKINLSWVCVIHCIHTIFHRYCMTTIFSHHAFWFSSCARCVEDIKRINALNRNWLMRLRTCKKTLPIQISSVNQICFKLLPLIDHTITDFMLGKIYCLVE